MNHIMRPVQKRSCPICRSNIQWGAKVGRCKCAGKNWPRMKLGGGPASATTTEAK